VTADLYQGSGQYWYRDGFNRVAIVSLLAGILPNVPGFLIAIGLVSKDSGWATLGGLYNYAWFIGFGVSAVVYGVLSLGLGSSKQPRSVVAAGAFSVRH
jgi:NCS1 family nucleobase:cation symporter-1